MLFTVHMLRRLQGQGVGTMGVNLFATSKSNIPKGNGPFITMIETLGFPGVRIHNQSKPAYERPSAQIVARSINSIDAYGMLLLAKNALSGVRDTVLGAASFSVAVTRTGSVATGTTTVPSYILPGEAVTITGADQAEYNGVHTVLTTPSATTFTFAVVGTPVSPATGSITAAVAGARYLEVELEQSAFIDLGVDDGGRARLAFNITAVKAQS